MIKNKLWILAINGKKYYNLIYNKQMNEFFDKYKKIILIIIIILAIEFSGHGIFASLFRLLS